MRFLTPALFFCVLVGCSTTQSLPVEDRSRTYDVAYDIAFDAIVTSLVEQGYAIEDADKDQGLINTDFLLQQSLASWLRGGTSRMKVSALVRDTEAGVRVVLNLALQDADEAFTGPNYSSRNLTARKARQLYTLLFEHIESVM